MGAKVDNTPRFVLPRIVETKTATVSITSGDSTEKEAYTADRDSLVTISITRSTAARAQTIDIILNGVTIGNTSNDTYPSINTYIQRTGSTYSAVYDRFLLSISGGSSAMTQIYPLILKKDDVISFKANSSSGTGNTNFTMTVDIWE
jgi:hypothetical protein